MESDSGGGSSLSVSAYLLSEHEDLFVEQVAWIDLAGGGAHCLGLLGRLGSLDGLLLSVTTKYFRTTKCCNHSTDTHKQTSTHLLANDERQLNLLASLDSLGIRSDLWRRGGRVSC